MLDITQNFTERINRLEALFESTDDDACRVITFDQSIRIKEHRPTVLAEDFTNRTRDGEDAPYHEVFLQQDVGDELHPHIVGYLSHDHVLILLELPPLIITDDLLSDITDHSVLSIELDRAPRAPDMQYDQDDPGNCWATMHRIQGNAFVHELLQRDTVTLTAYLAVDWKGRLRAILRAQVEHDVMSD